MLDALRRTKRLVGEGRLWRGAHRLCVYRDLFRRARSSDRPLDEHVEAALGWIKLAQDLAGDGGVSGRYRLKTGWTPSYPETTGYIVPTLLDLAERRRDGELVARAERMVSFLLRQQLPCGAFPSGELGPAPPRPAVFNTAQVILGLVAWHEAVGDERSLEAAVRAARWLVEVQDPDGAWRRFVYGGAATAYHAHAAWPLARCGLVARERAFVEAASRHVDWVLTLADLSTGWIDLMGFFPEDHRARRASTHTIGYTLKGLVELERVLGRGDCWQLVRTACEHMLRRIEVTGSLPGVLDHEWRGEVRWACLTGVAQVASVFVAVWRRFGDLRFLNAALKAVDLVRRTQVLASPYPELNGAVAGSFPLWGGYIALGFPNWAAKFFIDAAVDVKEALEVVRGGPRRPESAPHAPPDDEGGVRGEIRLYPPEVPRGESIEVLAGAAGPARRPLRVVLLSAPGSRKGHDAGAALLRRGVLPAAAVLDARRGGGGPLGRRLLEKLKGEGPLAVVRAVARAGRERTFVRSSGGRPNVRAGCNPDLPEHGRPIEDLCARHGIPIVKVPGLRSRGARRALQALEPDLVVLAGAGIVREGVLRIPRIGTVNAHMGLLPHFRGRNVAEWAALLGAAIGVSVHLVDGGIDTGRIIAVREVPAAVLAGGIDDLRARVDEAQLDLLAAVVAAFANGHDLPSVAQTPEQGVQFFAMHPALREVLAERLAEGRRAAAA